MHWLLLTFLSILSRAIYGVLTKVLSSRSKVSIYTQSVILPLAAMCLVFAISPFLGGIQFNLERVNWLTLVLMIIGTGVGNVTYFAAIKNLNSGTAQITFSSILIFNTVLSVIFLNLHLSLQNILGIIVLMIAVILVITGALEFHPQGTVLMIASAFSFAIFQLTSSQLATELGTVNYLIFAYAGAALIVFLYKMRDVIYDLKNLNDISSITIPFITAVPSIASYTFVFLAYRMAPEPAKVALLSTSQVVIAVILSYIFLKEHSNLARKTIAALLVVLAAYLIKL